MDRERLRSIVADVLRVGIEEVPKDASAETIEAWDSLVHLDIILAIEQTLNVQFKTEEIPQLTSLAKLEEALGQHGSGA